MPGGGMMAVHVRLLLVLLQCTGVHVAAIGSGRLALDSAAAATACVSDTDCSLNGVCSAGACACDKPWGGLSCGTLGFKPVSLPQGYGMVWPNKTTWGGNVLHDKDGDGQYHLFASAMTNGCGPPNPLAPAHVFLTAAFPCTLCLAWRTAR